MILVGDIVEYGLDSFNQHPQTWRVTHHHKRIEDTFDPNQTVFRDIAEEIIHNFMAQYVKWEKINRQVKGLPHTRRWYIVHCRPEEATHVSLTGISGAIAPIEECKFVKVVGWTEEMIKEQQQEAVSDSWLKDEFLRHLFWE